MRIGLLLVVLIDQKRQIIPNRSGIGIWTDNRIVQDRQLAFRYKIPVLFIIVGTVQNTAAPKYGILVLNRDPGRQLRKIVVKRMLRRQRKRSASGFIQFHRQRWIYYRKRIRCDRVIYFLFIFEKSKHL